MVKLITKQAFNGAVKTNTKIMFPKITTVSKNEKVATKQSEVKRLIDDCLVNVSLQYEFH
jgi:hypothetical protein